MAIPLIIGAGAAIAAAVGGKKAYDGYQDKSKADEILENAQSQYKAVRAIFDDNEESTNKSLDKLGALQLKIGSDFKQFRSLADELLAKLNQSEDKDLKVNFPKHKIDSIDGLAFATTEYLAKVAGAGVAGAAAAYAVYGGVMALGVASTGTSIASLSGVAAYNATMAAIGGGAISAGGLGMAGGAMVLGAAVAAPILAVAGWAYGSYGADALDKARETRDQINEIIPKLNLGVEHFMRTRLYVDKLYLETNRLNLVFKGYFDKLKGIDSAVSVGIDINLFNDEIIRVIENGYAVMSIITDVINTPLFKAKMKDGVVTRNEKGEIEMETDKDGFQVLNSDGLDSTLYNSKEQFN